MKPLCLALALSVAALAGSLRGQEGSHYALIVVGATGGQPYADSYWEWASGLRKTLCDKLGLPADHVQVLFEDPARDPAVTGRSTRAGVTAAVSALRPRVGAGDVVFVFLIGHSGQDAKFNLVGPDLSVEEWDALLSPLAGRLVVVNSASGSAAFVDRLSRTGRIVIAATDSPVQQYETVFPKFFVKAFDDPAADQDKNGRVSIWEAFAYATANVAQWYESRGQLATEHGVLDDAGLRRSGAAQPVADSGVLAKTTYLDVAPQAPAGAGEAVQVLYQKQNALEREVEELKARKASLPEEEYQQRLEKLLIQLAEVSRQIKTGRQP